MDNKIALERMKQLLCDISTKNETLNKENNDLNIKVLSLIKLLKAKDNQIDTTKKLLLKQILKNFFYKKYIIERTKLKQAFEKFKKLIINYNNNGLYRGYTPLLFYSHENDLYFPPSKKFNYTDIGIGDFKINYRFYIRKVACLTLLKRRKYIINIDENNKNKNNINGQDNGYKINLTFKNILPENKVINICIKSDRNKNNINKKEKYDLSVFHLDFIRNKEKNKVFDDKLLKSENICNNYSILSDRSSESNKKLKEQYDKDINNYVETIKIIEIDNNNLKLGITQKEKEIKNLEKKCKDSERQIKINKQEKNDLEKEILNIKKENIIYQKKIDDFSLVKNKMNEYENKYNNLNNMLKKKKLEIKIDNLNKFNLNINSTRINKDNNKIIISKIIKTNNITIHGNKKRKNNSFNNILSFKNGYFNILSNRKKKLILKKFNFSLNILNDNDNDNSSFFISSRNKNNKQLIVSNINSISYLGTKLNKQNKQINIEYDVIEPLKYEIDESKHNFINYNNKNVTKNFDTLELSDTFSFNIIHEKKIINNNLGLMKISKSFQVNIIQKNIKKDEIINNFKSSLSEIDKKNNYFRIIILDLKIKLEFYIKRKYSFFIKFQSLYYQNKITNSFKMFRSLLINLKMKSILKIIFNGSPKYYFLKYYFTKYKSNSLYMSLLLNKNELLKNIETNNKLNNQINIFQETFKKYEDSNTREKKEKDNIINKQKSLINNLNNEISEIKNQFEKMKKTAKDTAAELISGSNESNKQRKIIEKLNEELKTLQDNKIIYENQIKNQQEVIKNLNEKIKKDQFEYEQNEQDVNNQIEKLKTQFNEYENSIEDLNLQIINLKKENEKLKINNENLNNNKEELMILIQNNKNYEKENQDLLSQNEELKINNEEVNKQYIILKKDFDNLKMLSEESRGELSKAMSEMESYSELLQTLEMKIKEAESQKINAENERDKAINDVREIRQRYINIMGEKYA